MFPPRCTSCGVDLMHLDIPYRRGMDKINNSAKNKEERQKEIVKLINMLVENDCCARCIMTSVNLIHIVK